MQRTWKKSRFVETCLRARGYCPPRPVGDRRYRAAGLRCLGLGRAGVQAAARMASAPYRRGLRQIRGEILFIAPIL